VISETVMFMQDDAPESVMSLVRFTRPSPGAFDSFIVVHEPMSFVCPTTTPVPIPRTSTERTIPASRVVVLLIEYAHLFEYRV